MSEQVENQDEVEDTIVVTDAEQLNKSDTSTDDQEDEEETTQKAGDDEENEDDEETDEEVESKDDTERKVKKNGFKKRLDKKNQQIEKERQEKEYWRQQALESQKDKKPEVETVENVSKEGKPDPDDFEAYEDYIEALTDWKVDQKEQARQVSLQKEKATEQQKEFISKWQSKVSDFVAKTPDFEDVMEDAAEVELSKSVQEAIFDSDVGPQILYELAKDDDLAEKISKLSPVAAAREIGKLEARIESNQETKPIKPKTKAPNPITPVRGGGRISKDLSNPNLTQKEYEELRAKQLANKAS